MLISPAVYHSLFVFFLSLPVLALILLLRKKQLGSLPTGALLGITCVLALAFILVTGSKSRNVYVVHENLSVSRYVSYFGGSYGLPDGKSLSIDLEFKRSCLVINLSKHHLKLEGRGITTLGRRGRSVEPGEAEVLGCETIDYFPLDRPTGRQANPRGLNSVFWLQVDDARSEELRYMY